MMKEMHISYLAKTKNWLEKKSEFKGIIVRCYIFDHKEKAEQVL